MAIHLSHSPTAHPARRLLTLLAAALPLAACAVPDLGPRPQLTGPAQLAAQRSLASDTVAAQWPDDRWWRRYGDAQLNTLVAEALARSPSVAEAAARVRSARGVLEQAGAPLQPQVSTDAQVSGTKQSYNLGIPKDFVPKGIIRSGLLSASADLDLDLWGRNRAQLAAATSDLVAAQVDARQAALMLTADLVSTYADLARAYAVEDVLERAVEERASSVDLAQQRYDGGLDSLAPVRRYQAALSGARADLAANEEQIATLRHALAALLGAGPDRGLAIARPDFADFPPTPVPADAGIALAGRRPDIVAARLRVEGQDRRIAAARAAFLPDISLSGLIGLNSLGLDKLFEGDSSYGHATAALSLPIFQGGRLRGQLRQTRGEYDVRVAQYDATVVDALREVADAVASRTSARIQALRTAEAYDAARQGYDLAHTRYRGGLADYVSALTAEDTMLTAQRRAIEARARLVTLDVALVRALGGGFAPADIPDAVPSSAGAGATPLSPSVSPSFDK